MINGHSNRHCLDEEIYFPFQERVQDLEVPIYLHPCDPYDMPYMYLARPQLLGASWSWTVETATHALRLVFGGTFDRFPKLRLILGHMGETLPYLQWPLDSRSRIQSRHGTGHDRIPSEIIRKNIAITTAGVCSHAALPRALEALREDNVMFSVIDISRARHQSPEL